MPVKFDGRNRYAWPVFACLALALPVAAQCPRGGATGPRFSVVSVKRLLSDTPSRYPLIRADPGRLTVPNLTLQWLIMEAYGMRLDQVTGGPNWMGQDKFSLIATTARPASREEELMMLRGALIERFQLACHEVTQPEKVLALTVMHGGPKFKPLAAGGVPSAPGANQLVFPMLSRLILMLNNFAHVGLLAHPVVDETNLAGSYDIHLHVGIDNGARGAVALGPKQAAEIPMQIEQQLGLKLVAKTEPVTTLIVDHAALPTGN